MITRYYMCIRLRESNGFVCFAAAVLPYNKFPKTDVETRHAVFVPLE